MTYKPKTENYECDSCKQNVQFATKTSCNKGDICYECRRHAYESCNFNNPTLKEVNMSKAFKKCEAWQLGSAKRQEYINQDAVNNKIQNMKLTE